MADPTDVSATDRVDALIDLVLMHIASRDDDGVVRRLVLRRTVAVPDTHGDAAAVDQLWISEPLRGYPAVDAVLRGLATAGTRLLRGHPVAELPGMAQPTRACLPDLDLGLGQDSSHDCTDGALRRSVGVVGTVVAGPDAASGWSVA